MKNKSSRHKDENTFKFQKFSDRISAIDVDIFHKVAHEYEEAEEDESCHFHQAVEKWNVLNLTGSYDAFKRDAKVYGIITLPQLLHSKENIVQTLITHLQKKDILCIQPLLECVVAVARDLGNDFYPYYYDVFNVLVDLLKTQDTDQLEWTFHCLAYLFKILWRALVKDIGKVFLALLPLLSDSNQEYINHFAAESFAFVARKVKDRRSFLRLIMKAVKNQEDGISGCGKLLFEVIHGVEGQFHSCAQTVFPFLLESLSDEKISQLELFQVLQYLITNIAGGISSKQMDLLWDTFTTSLDKTITDWTPNNLVSTNQLEYLLVLVGQTVEHKQGKLLQSPSKLIKEIKRIVALKELPYDTLQKAVNISILILLSKNIKLTQEESSLLIRSILSVKNEKCLLHFVKNTLEYFSFEIQILPTFLKHCVESNFEQQAMELLPEIILQKAPICGNGIDLANWTKYEINFGTHNKKIEKLMRDCIEDVKDFEKYVCALICIPHLNLSGLTDFQDVLKRNFEVYCKEITEKTEEKILRKELFVLYNTLLTLVQISGKEQVLCLKDIVLEKIVPITTNPNLIVALKLLDVFLVSVGNLEQSLGCDYLEKMHPVLQTNFNSPYHDLRLLTSHIYSLFECTGSFSKENWNVFSICYNTESIQPLVNTYRDQLQYLEKLDFEKQPPTTLTSYQTIPLRYLCGVLYMNFKLVWDPAVNLISSYAHGIKRNEFWEVYLEILQEADKNVRNPLILNSEELEGFELIKNLHKKMFLLDDKPDFVNQRVLLWKAMAMFADIAESKSRNISVLLLDFMQEEYMSSNSAAASKWNIKQHQAELLEETMEVDIEEEEEQKDEEPKDEEQKGEGQKENEEIKEMKKELTKPVPQSGTTKNNAKTLLQYLTVFSKIKNPKTMYKEQDLYNLYFDLIAHKNPSIQKVALDCLLTYKFKYMTPYQDNLHNLIDDKNFKNELTAFKIDKESSIIQEEHRANLLPIVMRIVFSKMFAKTGMRTGGKSSGQLRRNLILRFLSGSKEEEMMSFINMSFRLYHKFLSDDIEAMVKNIIENINLENFVPPKRLQSSVNLISVVFEQFGNHMQPDILKYLLKIIFVIGAHLKGAYKNHSQIHSGYLAVLRNLRTSTIKLVERFFDHFESYPWSAQEINCVFELFIWPYLLNLNMESIHSPTTLLKLICLWGSNPQYFSLLVKYEEGKESYNPIASVMDLYVNPKAHITVSNLITEMLEKLLSLKMSDEEKTVMLPVENVLKIKMDFSDKLKSKEGLNYGSCLLLPHVDTVLEKIRRKLEGKYGKINTKELFILSRISELTWESDKSGSVLNLLLPIVLKKCMGGAGEEVLVQLLTSIYNLVQNVKEPEVHLKQISPLFGYVNSAPARKILCGTLNTISQNSELLKETNELILGINAFDARWVDQPDFQKRLDSFKRIKELSENDVLTKEAGILIVYNCYYSFSNESDLSLRDTSTHCLQVVVPNLVRKYERFHVEIKYILDDTILTLIRNGIKNHKSEIRNECISLLGHLARECPTAHVVLRDLNKLTNKVDMEVDFFENLTHLQSHRQGRALLKFTQVYKESDVGPSIRTLTQFILPLTTHYLCSEKYANKHSLVDSAIDTLETICKFLPGHQYMELLKYYLNKLRHKLDYQKQLVKIIVHIMDAFHYDLSKGQNEIGKENLTKKTAPMDVEEDKAEEEKTVEGEDGKEEEENLVEDIIGDSMIEDGAEDETTMEVEEKEAVKPYNKITVLNKSGAVRLIQTIQNVLLPQLRRSLAVMTTQESTHKVNKKQTYAEKEEEDLLRVPISLAVVKLLQRLPKKILDSNLPGVFMKLCTFLKSKLESIRRTARETLQSIMKTLGPEYLSVLLGEMTSLLSKGFQVHVLVYTVHSVLSCLRDAYKPKDMDNILLLVINICKADLFEALSDEKEVLKIVTKTSEAKATKSYDTFQIMAQYITEKCIMDLILPIKSVLSMTSSFKLLKKAQDCLRHITLGLIDNTFISPYSLIKFSYGLTSESIPKFLQKDKPKTEKDAEKNKIVKNDCFIIQKAPTGRYGGGAAMKKNNNNEYVLVEFGLLLCNFILKRGKLPDEDFKPLMDPFVGVFKSCLTSKHVRISTLTLQCLQWILKIEMPSLKRNMSEILKSLFEILHKYGSAGLSKGDNFELVVAAFKTMAIFVREVKYVNITTDQLKILVLYVEQDLHDSDNHASAFGLLRAIISRKLSTPELHQVMAKVAELSITSEMVHIRLQSRTVFYQYLMDYPLGKKLHNHIRFYLAQMKYELQFGRESAIEMLHTIIRGLPMPVLLELSEAMFVTMSVRLVNDEVPACRKMVAECITSLITRLKKSDRNPIFEMILLWFKDDMIMHKRLAAQLCGIFITVEKSSFETRLPKLVPLLLLQFSIDVSNKPGKFVKIKTEKVTKNMEQNRDHHLYQVLQMMLKLCSHCPSFLKETNAIENLSAHIQTLLGYPHDWVRLAAAQFLGFVLSSIDVPKLSNLLLKNKKLSSGYLYTDPFNGIKSLTLDLCAQLIPDAIKSDMAEQVIKNLLFIAKVIQKLPIRAPKTDSSETYINLLWLIKTLRKIINAEVIQGKKSIVLRTEIFKFIAGVVTVIDKEVYTPILYHFLTPLVREMITTEVANAPLRQLSKEVANMIKSKVGVELYTDALHQSQQKLSVKRAERKRSRTQLAITDPELYARKKIKLNEKKKEAKRVKVSKMKGVYRKKKEFSLEDD